MDRTRRPEDDIPQFPHPSSPDQTVQKSTNIPQSKTKLTDIGSHPTTSGQAPQERSSYGPSASTVRTPGNEHLDKQLDSAAGADPIIPMAALGQPSRSGPHPTDNQTAVISVEPSTGFQTKMERGDANQFDIELDTRPRAGQVSPCTGIVLRS